MCIVRQSSVHIACVLQIYLRFVRIWKAFKMPKKDRILRSYLSMYTNRNRQKAKSDVKYSVNFEYLMTGEGITGTLKECIDYWKNA